jgi:hypothetical protein
MRRRDKVANVQNVQNVHDASVKIAALHEGDSAWPA